MTVIIDRIEEGFAIVELEDASIVKVPLQLFENPNEGAAYIIEPTKNPVSKRIEELMNEVFDD